jgi:hypothetical protein
MSASDWRTGTGFDWSQGQGLRALAWEFLRLNPDFRALVRTDPDAAALARWGLRSRRRHEPGRG